MKKKILSILLIGFLVVGLTGCTKSETKEDNKKKLDITGSWTLSRKVAVSDTRYASLRELFGDSLGSGEGALILNDDNTFSITIALSYNTTGNYKIDGNIITFSDIKDKNIANEKSLKEREKNLKLEYIEYNNHKFMKMKLEDDDFDAYIFFEKDPESTTGSYADDDIPEVSFSTEDKDEDTPKNTGNSNYEKTSDGLKINGYTLKFGTYSGTYRTTQTESWDDAYTAEKKIKINSNDTITFYGAPGDEFDYAYKIENSKIVSGNNVIEIVGNNKVKFSVDDLVLEYKGE